MLRAVIAGTEPLEFATSRLADVDTVHAMTIHKSQGSQAKDVTVLMPPEDSRLLTRELFYTAVTRAKQKIRVVGPESAVRAAIETARGSGLWPGAQVTRPPFHRHQRVTEFRVQLLDGAPCSGDTVKPG